MCSCKPSCICLSVIIGIIAGVILGVLYSIGLIATGIIFWVYLAFGVIALLLTPLYASSNARPGAKNCFCLFRRLILTASVGSIIASAIGLIVATVASLITVATVLAIATFFLAMLLVAIICFINCLCDC